MARSKIQALTALILIALAVAVHSAEVSSRGAQSAMPDARSSSSKSSIDLKGRSLSPEDDNCAACHRKGSGQEVALYRNSTHARAAIACNLCHGGDAAAKDKESAHKAEFVGLPTPEQTLDMCGACHLQQLAAFKTGRHFPESRRSPRLDCSQCHGAHLVGSPERNFSFAYYCAGCHGQEYLPRLPEEFQKMLATVDELADAKRTFAEKGRALPEEFVKRRREVRRLIAEIVHPTDLQKGMEKSSDIVRLGDGLKKLLEQ
ncbi:MAG: cytochrome c3 family protein [Blastocatellia bacterium]|nr:cytochrome c3 family protein [Blastocatellia bacterium]